MSVKELLSLFQSLSPREQKRFFNAVLALEGAPSQRSPKNKWVKWPNVELRARRVVGKKVLPNLVLLERDEEGL